MNFLEIRPVLRDVQAKEIKEMFTVPSISEGGLMLAWKLGLIFGAFSWADAFWVFSENEHIAPKPKEQFWAQALIAPFLFVGHMQS